MTAWHGLFDRGRLEQGQTVLIAGAAGGIGHLAVQFAKHAGARVIGTGSSRSRDFVLGLGADEFIDYTDQDVADIVSHVDVALDRRWEHDRVADTRGARGRDIGHRRIPAGSASAGPGSARGTADYELKIRSAGADWRSSRIEQGPDGLSDFPIGAKRHGTAASGQESEPESHARARRACPQTCGHPRLARYIASLSGGPMRRERRSS
jgi:hypothetical protein